MLTYLTVTLTTLGVAHLVDDGLSPKVSRYSINQLNSLTILCSLHRSLGKLLVILQFHLVT